MIPDMRPYCSHSQSHINFTDSQHTVTHGFSVWTPIRYTGSYSTLYGSIEHRSSKHIETIASWTVKYLPSHPPSITAACS